MIYLVSGEKVGQNGPIKKSLIIALLIGACYLLVRMSFDDTRVIDLRKMAVKPLPTIKAAAQVSRHDVEVVQYQEVGEYVVVMLRALGDEERLFLRWVRKVGTLRPLGLSHI